VVGKIARLFALKGHDDLIDAASDMVRRIPELRFLLVGDGAWRARLQQKIQQQGLGAFFVFAGLVPPATIPELLGIMDLVVHLSRREGLARALPQALAAGRPIVAFDCDGASEVCLDGRTGFLVPPDDLDQLRDRIIHLAADPGLRSACGNAGRELVRERFSLQRMIDDLTSLYEQLLATRDAI
jgi:glycosyltransferase involved in cell wall biosynthesis